MVHIRSHPISKPASNIDANYKTWTYNCTVWSCYIRSYMQMYALALRTSSSVVSRTMWSLMYAH